MAKLLLGALLLLTNGGSVNFFSLKQDVELGSESAKEAEQSLALVRDLNIDGYFRGIGQRLSQNRTLPALKYRRHQQLEAGLLAVRLMADARFDPNAFRILLEKINEIQTGETSRAPAFVFNHPQSDTIAPEIAEEIERLTAGFRRARAPAE